MHCMRQWRQRICLRSSNGCPRDSRNQAFQDSGGIPRIPWIKLSRPVFSSRSYRTSAALSVAADVAFFPIKKIGMKSYATSAAKSASALCRSYAGCLAQVSRRALCRSYTYYLRTTFPFVHLKKTSFFLVIRSPLLRS